MRFRTLKFVSATIVVIVLLVCVCVALVRKFVIPAPPGKHHAVFDLPRTIIANPDLRVSVWKITSQ